MNLFDGTDLLETTSTEVKNRILKPGQMLRAIDTGALYYGDKDGKPTAFVGASTSSSGELAISAGGTDITSKVGAPSLTPSGIDSYGIDLSDGSTLPLHPATRPIVEIGSYTGTGVARTVALASRPALLFMGTPGSDQPYIVCARHAWYSNAIPMHLSSTLAYGARLKDGAIDAPVGNSAGNYALSGVEYHYAGITDNKAGAVIVGDWAGNPDASRTIKLSEHDVEFVAIKRDTNAVEGVIASPYFTAQNANGSATYPGVSIDKGSITLSPNDNHYNYWSSGVGESAGYFALCRSPYTQVLRYTGTGAAQNLRMKFSKIQWFQIYRLGASHSPTAWQSSLAGGAHMAVFGKELGGTGRITSVSQGVVTLGTDANVNASGGEYVLVAIGDCATPSDAVEPARTLKSTARVVLGAGQYADFGTACSIDGPMTLQWCGLHNNGAVNTWSEDPDSAAWSPLIWRGAGANDTEGNANWGIMVGGNKYAYAPEQGLWIVAHNQANMKGSSPFNADANGWQTGVATTPGQLTDIIVSHDGLGGWYVMIDGKVKKFRQRDCMQMATPGPRPNIKGEPGHRMIYGGRVAASGVQQTARTTEIHSVRIWNRYLSPEEARRVYLSKFVGGPAFSRAGLIAEHVPQGVSGPVWADSSGNAADGALIGGVAVVPA